jgi:two-component system sensor histidine kinase EvgS
MGGTIICRSKEGTGTTFRLNFSQLEIAPKGESRSKTSKIRPDRIQFNPAIVLVADDDAENRKLLLDVFKDTALKVIEATNGEKAVEMAEIYNPDIILMDLKMPGLSGYDALKSIRAMTHTRDIPVLVLTATVYNVNEEILKAKGFNEYIIKPIQIDEVIFMLAKYLTHTVIDAPESINKPVKEPDLDDQDSLQLDEETINEIREQLLSLWQEIKERQSSRNIQAFSDGLSEIGRRNENEDLVRFAGSLAEHYKRFDITGLRKLLIDFKQIIEP